LQVQLGAISENEDFVLWQYIRSEKVEMLSNMKETWLGTETSLQLGGRVCVCLIHACDNYNS